LNARRCSENSIGVSVMPVDAIRDFFKMEAAGGIVLVMAAALAVAVSNSPFHGLYDALLTLPTQIRIGALNIEKPLLLWINDGLMAIFFFLFNYPIWAYLIPHSNAVFKFFTLHYWLGLTTREIALVLKKGEPLVKAHLQRGRKQMRRWLTENGMENGMSEETLKIIRKDRAIALRIRRFSPFLDILTVPRFTGARWGICHGLFG